MHGTRKWERPIYKYTFNPLKCRKVVIEDTRGELHYPSEFEGYVYYHRKPDSDIDITIWIGAVVKAKNEWFDIEEIEVLED